ncbi:glycosyltransferase family 4 protein [Conyzicola sp.]|uniref:glycosyltransferase family 4 protein n=1 Tax=Conyzicola sp. TaxID=1969404 RepID=UPI003988F5AB
MPNQTNNDRLGILLAALEPGARRIAPTGELVAMVAKHLANPTDDVVWLALAVLNARFPVRDDIVTLRRRLRLESPVAVISQIASARLSRLGHSAPPVRVLTGHVVVDVHHTARTGLATGIQRVVRKTIAEWDEKHDITLVGWNTSLTSLRLLSRLESENAMHGTAPHAHPDAVGEVLIPWKCDYILPELAIEDDRTSRIAALAEFSGNTAALIGFDCVPLTSAETIGAGMGAGFSRNLVAAAHFSKIATISEAAAAEYGGWRTMLGSAGLTGPHIQCVFLPADAGVVSEAGVESARATLGADDLPLLFCVGSHEPRKNHLAVLTAAELLWKQGREFSLAFVGGNAWGSEQFQYQLAELQRRGRPVKTVSAITDELLWGGYRAARCTVFPSLNEGFGLPVAESLAMGTPVVTSNYGSMAEIAAGGGAVLVDPRDEQDLARGLASVLFDDDVNTRLRAEASARSTRTWAHYADDVWGYFFPSA